MTVKNDLEVLRQGHRDLRAKHQAAMEAIVAKANGEGRTGLTRAEASEFEEHEGLVKQLDRSIGDSKGADPLRGAGVRSAGLNPADERAEQAFTRYLRSGIPTSELRTTYDAGLNEAGFQDSGTAGGFLVPAGFWTNLQIAQKAYGGLSQFYRPVETATGTPMAWPTSDPTGNSGHIIAEGVVDDFQAETIGQGVLNAWTYSSKVILVSLELVQDSAFDISSFVAARIGERLGRAESAHSASGTGSGQPLGLITALNAKGAVSGASGGYVQLGSATTTNYVGGGDTTKTEIVGNLIAPQTAAAMVQAIDPAYWTGDLAWYMNANQLTAMQQVADGFGRYLWPSLQQANPTLLSFPVRVSQAIPDITASTTGGPVLADLSVAMVRRTAGPASVLTLRERYADARQVGYFGYVRLDHRSNDLRAAVTVKAAST